MMMMMKKKKMFFICVTLTGFRKEFWFYRRDVYKRQPIVVSAV